MEILGILVLLAIGSVIGGVAHKYSDLKECMKSKTEQVCKEEMKIKE